MAYEKKEPSVSQSENANTSINIAIDNFKNIIGISANSKIKIINRSEQPDKTMKITISYSGEHPIKTEIDEILVSTPLTAELYFDKDGKLLNYKTVDPDPNIMNTLKEEVNYMLKEKQIQLPTSNNETSKSLSKEFYIEKDKEGKQHLKRSHFSSH